MGHFIRSTTNIIVLIAGLAGVLSILYAWGLPPFKSSIERTDNAYVKGYVTVLAPQVPGNVAEVAVKDYQKVKQGQLLVRIDDRIFQQKLAQAKAIDSSKKASLANSHQQEESALAKIRSAEAQIVSAKAALHKAVLNWERIHPLAEKGITSQSNADNARATLDQAKAAVDQANAAMEVARQDLQTILTAREGLIADVAGAEAAVQLARIDLDHSRIYAPRDGRVGEVGAKLGQYVSVGTQLMAVVPDDVWIIANYKETQLDHMKIGQPVSFSVDALGGQRMTGRVERFSPAAGSEFSVLKPDNATGNFTKVSQRIPVRIKIDPGQKNSDRLVPGMSVVTSVNTRAPGLVQTNETGAPQTQSPETKGTSQADRPGQ